MTNGGRSSSGNYANFIDSKSNSVMSQSGKSGFRNLQMGKD